MQVGVIGFVNLFGNIVSFEFVNLSVYDVFVLFVVMPNKNWTKLNYIFLEYQPHNL